MVSLSMLYNAGSVRSKLNQHTHYDLCAYNNDKIPVNMHAVAVFNFRPTPAVISTIKDSKPSRMYFSAQ